MWWSATRECLLLVPLCRAHARTRTHTRSERWRAFVCSACASVTHELCSLSPALTALGCEWRDAYIAARVWREPERVLALREFVGLDTLLSTPVNVVVCSPDPLVSAAVVRAAIDALPPAPAPLSVLLSYRNALGCVYVDRQMFTLRIEELYSGGVVNANATLQDTLFGTLDDQTALLLVATTREHAVALVALLDSALRLRRRRGGRSSHRVALLVPVNASQQTHQVCRPLALRATTSAPLSDSGGLTNKNRPFLDLLVANSIMQAMKFLKKQV